MGGHLEAGASMVYTANCLRRGAFPGKWGEKAKELGQAQGPS